MQHVLSLFTMLILTTTIAMACVDSGARQALTLCTMTQNTTTPASLVNMRAFTKPAGATAATNTFSGRLTLFGLSTSGSFQPIKVTDPVSATSKHLPPFSFDFVQDTQGNIIPTIRGVIQPNPNGHPDWEYILEPGKVWNEASDRGYSRVSIPFSLQRKNQNCIHNGVLSFLFKNNGAISKVSYQISSETCWFLHANMWGLVNATYSPAVVVNAAAIIASHAAEVTNRMTTKPISALLTDFPNRGINLAQIGKLQAPQHMSAYGLIVGNVHYVGGCQTRHGTYPYCDVMDLPSFSTAKSAFAATALMRLEKLYPGAKSSIVGAYVSQCTDGVSTWSDVTFADALDMATGNYNSPLFEVDEGVASHAFFASLSHANKINFACGTWPRRVSPGVIWNYHTSDTYVLTTAMNRFLKSKAGPIMDIFNNIIVNDLWARLNISPTARVSKRSYDAVGQSWGGYGINLHRDDVAKISTFLNVNGGKIGAVSMLNPVMLQQALQKGGAAPYGLQASTTEYYKYGFWSFNAQASLACAKPQWIPSMSGFGGITIALLPSGITYYYFSDNKEFSWLSSVIEANKIKTSCMP